MAIKIITDSGCDLPKEIIEKYSIKLLPLYVYLDDKPYLDGVTIEHKAVYDGMRKGNVYKTAQVPPNIFYDAFKECVENNDTCIYIGFSSELSGTYQSSMIAKEDILEEYPNFDIHVIDTKCASLGFGLVVYKAAQIVSEGKTKEEVLESIEFNSKHMEGIFTVDDLEYLFRGGRVSRSSAVIGGILNIKPILNVDKGKLIPIDKIRGKKKVLKRILELVRERGVDLENQTIAISHGDDVEEAEKLKGILEEEFGCKNFLISTIGGVIGSHVGPGTIAVFFLNDIK
ncbi:degV family protein [Clostridium novyi A str. 4552]|uniref:DegV family protein n=1 Tax=Clostridium novyi A str. 4552 TaxID=1444289 RepID=A0A0A0I427_CLONO|nr:DegV family protein [Clostridium novyi]KGM96129.1 degV family protein [Clostridium novyi A str. 4552]